jgi:hypothetical protein
VGRDSSLLSIDEVIFDAWNVGGVCYFRSVGELLRLEEGEGRSCCCSYIWSSATRYAARVSLGILIIFLLGGGGKV